MSSFLLGTVVSALRGLSHSSPMKSLQDEHQNRPCITEEQTSADASQRSKPQLRETGRGSVGANGTAGSLMLEPPARNMCNTAHCGDQFIPHSRQPQCWGKQGTGGGGRLPHLLLPKHFPSAAAWHLEGTWAVPAPVGNGFSLALLLSSAPFCSLSLSLHLQTMEGHR